MSLIVVGADIGKERDPSAVVVTEYQRVLISPAGQPIDDTGLRDLLNIATGVEDPPVYDTRYLVRSLTSLQLGTPYPVVAIYIANICKAMLARDPKNEVYLAVDVTGVGAPVVDLIEEVILPQVHITRVTLGGSDKCPPSPLFEEEITLGKTWMVSRLQALLQSYRLVMPETLEAEALAKELIDFQIRVSRDAQTEMGAFGKGKHDDLVTACGLSVLGEGHMNVHYGPSLWGHSS